MRFNRTLIAILLVCGFAVRALVPAGYMLASPPQMFGFTLALCPLQNSNIDLSRLDSFNAAQHKSHHGHHDDNGDHDSDSSGRLAVTQLCSWWQESAQPLGALGSANANPLFAHETLKPLQQITSFAPQFPRGHAFPRAPPLA